MRFYDNRNLFGSHKWESVRCFMNGLYRYSLYRIGKLDFEHNYLWLRIKSFKSNAVCDNVVINKLSIALINSVLRSLSSVMTTALILTLRFTL